MMKRIDIGTIVLCSLLLGALLAGCTPGVGMTPDLEGQLREPVPLWCPEPYWLMGEIVHK